MRRNIRGGLRGGQNWQNNSRATGGPLLTDHLDLQDIDKELELLQRKREIIEQQQQILSNEFRRNDYQDPYRASQSSRFDDYTQSYDDVREYNPSGRKRPIQVWDNDVPSKRFSGPVKKSRPYGQSSMSIPPLMRSGPSYRGGYQGSLPRQSRPLSGPFKPKPQKRDPIPPKRDFNPPKRDSNGSKAIKFTAAPEKSSAPAADPKVPESGNRSEPPVQDLANMLCSDREPSKHVTGRLELALGSIIKEIKAADPTVVKSTPVMRDIKAAVRERIREVMMDSVVGPADTIVARYREVYDAQSDLVIVTNALDAQSGEVTLLKIEDPEKYFKVNMHKIMQLKLKSLLEKLQQICQAECEKPIESGDASMTKTEETEAAKPWLDEKITNTPKFMLLEKWMTNRMTTLIKKFHPFIMKLMDIDHKYNKLKNVITCETVKMLMQKEEELGETSDETMRSINESLSSNKTSTPRAPYKPLPYFAKLMGKPSLPKRNQMEKFFSEFNPKSIKKHRAVHNLLFVGFTDKESFEKILAADGTMIGRYTLSIRVSERSLNVKTEQSSTELNASANEKINKSELDDDLIKSELDDQITDLLSCIRKAEEEAGQDTDENTAADANNTSNAADNNETHVTENENNDNDETYVPENDDANITESADAQNTNAGNAEKADTGKAEKANAGNAEKAEASNVENADVDNAEKADTNNGLSTAPGNGVVIEKETEVEKDDIAESTDTVQPLDAKTPVKATPARASARLAATPGRIQTRRASRMTQNDA